MGVALRSAALALREGPEGAGPPHRRDGALGGERLVELAPVTGLERVGARPGGEGEPLGVSSGRALVVERHRLARHEVRDGREVLERHRGAGEAEADAAPAPIQRGAGERVLLVEDEPLVRRVMERMLSDADYRVTTAGNGLEALELLDGGLRPDVVLSDVVMPRMGGLELREKLRARGVPVVLMSGYSSEVVELGGVDDSELLWKPPSRPAVLAAIRRALGR